MHLCAQVVQLPVQLPGACTGKPQGCGEVSGNDNGVGATQDVETALLRMPATLHKHYAESTQSVEAADSARVLGAEVCLVRTTGPLMSPDCHAQTPAMSQPGSLNELCKDPSRSTGADL